uniref:Chromosome transmission fidelity protein 8 n=1 Tax=Odontella aurita TaxID=265563 RepID=A0A6U6DE37_9STRA|mmetsp:Transcript_19841/g.57557  ORF Transcript_19841/g.57557 Transcript_19841/m.57557 type:complete len:137 (+) Transcript_19841:33-443(+)
MIIPITAASDGADDTPQEWSLLELNGELIPPSNTVSKRKEPSESQSSGGASGQRVELGAVRFVGRDRTPVMTMGSHELKGKVEELKQPFVILRKRKRPENGGDVGGGSGGGETSFEVAGIIRKKMLFDQYPKSIMR